MIGPKCSGEKNTAGEIVPAFMRTKRVGTSARTSASRARLVRADVRPWHLRTT